MLLAMARPRPWPSMVSSSRTPRPAICASPSGGQPGPSSSTVRTVPPASRAEINTRDRAHLQALSSRLPHNSSKSSRSP